MHSDLVITICPETKQHPDRWVVSAPGIFVYGKTRDEADLEFEKVLTALVERFGEDQKRLKDWLKATNTQHMFDPLVLQSVDYPKRHIAIKLA